MLDGVQLLEPGDAARLLERLLALRAGYVPEWRPGCDGAGAALARIAVRYIQAIYDRLGPALDKAQLAYLDQLSIGRVAAKEAGAPVVFRLADTAPDARVPAGTRVTAPPPPGRSDAIVFETERSLGVAVAKLRQVVSFWPGRDQYIDHTTAVDAGREFRPFRRADLIDSPHALFIAHDTLLALAGEVTVLVGIDLTTASSQHLALVWEYWDGKAWRGFHEADQNDGTDGLRQSGNILLATDCAEAQKTTVDGKEAFWLRGRLKEPLPPEPARILPEIDVLTLRTSIDRRLEFVPLKPVWQRKPQNLFSLTVRVQDAAGAPIAGVEVELVDAAKAVAAAAAAVGTGAAPPPTAATVAAPAPAKLTDAAGLFAFPTVAAASSTQSKTVTVRIGPDMVESFTFTPPAQGVDFMVTFQVKGIPLDKAAADALPLDLTKTIYPFGLQPQPGNAFYFRCEEAFAKPGAEVQMFVNRVRTPQDEIILPKPDVAAGAPAAVMVPKDPSRLNHVVAWEYWDGRQWAALFPAGENVRDLDKTEIIPFTVPADLAPVKVNDEEGHWLRARLVSGGFGTLAAFGNSPIPFVLSKPPALSTVRIGFTWQSSPLAPERVLTYNDFQYEDRTEEAKWVGDPFAPFRPPADATPGLFLGFDRALPVDSLGIYFDIDEQPGETEGPALVWEYWDGFVWQHVEVVDETNHLRVPGLVSFIGPADNNALARFGVARHWVRARLKEDGPPGEPVLNGIFPNAVYAAQRQTITDEPLGASTGQANQVFTFRQVPVLAGQIVEVRESLGRRANVEWRLLARDLFKDAEEAIAELERLLGVERPQPDVVYSGLRLKRDRHKRVVEAWVRWEERPNFYDSGPRDRHYTLDRASGRLQLGDGLHGMIPPPAAALLARLYRSGGGAIGNVAARTLTQVLGAIGGLEECFNPVAAEGGADAETLTEVRARGPQSVRHRGRAVLPADYQTLALEASPAVAVARVLSARDPAGRPAPGWVTVVIIPRSDEPRPWPSFGLREAVRRFLEARAPATVAQPHTLYITGPEYFPVDVDATLVPVDATEAGAVSERVRAALLRLLHPLHGGPDGAGWEPGRAVFLSDVAAVVERVAGVDYVRELALLKEGVPQGERLVVPAGQVVVAGELRLKLLGK